MPGQRERADQERDVRARQEAPQAAHLPHVLLADERVDDDARGEEEQRLEEGVRHQVEHRARVRAKPRGEEHVADLRHRRVGDDALDVDLDECDQPGEQDGRSTEAGGKILDARRRLEDRRRAHEQVDAGGDHRRRVDERADRGRALHRVGEPGLERELRRLRDGAAEEPERDEVDRPGAGLTARPLEGRVERQRAGALDEQEEGERHRRVAERVHDERLLGGGDRARPLVVEADQQVGAEPDEAPADEQQQQVAALDEQEHREDEQRHVREVAALLVLAVHVADRVADDQRADTGDDEHHEDRERVDEQGQADLEVAGREPRPGRGQVRALLGRVAEDREERKGSGDERDGDGQRREVAARAARQAVAAERDQHGCRERREAGRPRRR